MTRNIRFDRRVAVVTGAASGLGRSHARLLAERGAAVVVNDPAKDDSGYRADAVVAEIIAAGGAAVADYNSVDDPAQATALIDHARDHFGAVDILVNNAGFLRDRTFGKMDLADFDAVIRVHLSGTAYVTRAAWGPMRDAGYGRIVFTSSNSGLFGNFGQSNYAAAKAGILGLMNTLKLEGERYGIKVNTIAPMAATPMTQEVMTDETKLAFQPAMVSAAVAYLCSELCTDTGRTISVAGGYLAAVQIASAAGVVLNPDAATSPEEVARRWAEICDFGAARNFNDAGAEMREIMTRLQAAKTPA